VLGQLALMGHAVKNTATVVFHWVGSSGAKQPGGTLAPTGMRYTICPNGISWVPRLKDRLVTLAFAPRHRLCWMTLTPYCAFVRFRSVRWPGRSGWHPGLKNSSREVKEIRRHPLGKLGAGMSLNWAPAVGIDD
jgi:hypothetical protein